MTSMTSMTSNETMKGIEGGSLIPISKANPAFLSLSDRNVSRGSSNNLSATSTTMNASSVSSTGSTIPSTPQSTLQYQTSSISAFADSQPYACLDSSRYPVFAPKFTIPQELLTPKNRLSGSGSDGITDSKAVSGKVSPKPTPPPQEVDSSKSSKVLYYETNLALTDFIKSIYGIVGPTTGRGRDIGTSTLSSAERLQNRKMLYKNISPIPPAPIPESLKPRRLMLVLDLDETLVHAFIGLKTPLPCHDAHVEITTTLGNPPRKSVNAMYIRYRPHISEFMSAVAPLFDVVLFTAARPIYADTLMNVMDPRGSVIGKSSRFFRDFCTDVYNKYDSGPSSPKQGSSSSVADEEIVAAVAREAGCDASNTIPPLAEPGFIRTKDLTKLGRPLEEIVFIDNTPTCSLMQPRNLLPISSWFGKDTADSGLLDVLPVLKKIAKTRDVYGCLDEYCASMTPTV